MLRIPHNVLNLFQAEESQKKRRTQEGNDKGGPLLHSTQTSVLPRDVSIPLTPLFVFFLSSASSSAPRFLPGFL